MPTRPPGPCTWPGCTHLAERGNSRCADHPHLAWAGSDRRSRLPSDWETRRRRVLERDGYQCQLRLPGCTHLATECDHVTAGDDHRLSNLQGACHSCHARKSAREGHRARRGVG